MLSLGHAYGGQSRCIRLCCASLIVALCRQTPDAAEMGLCQEMAFPGQLPNGLRYWPEFITEAEEAELIQAVDGPGHLAVS